MFKDAQGRNWDATLTVAALRRIRSNLKIDLWEIEQGDPPLAVRLATDPLLISDLLYQILYPSLQEAGVSEEDFGEAMGPAELAAAYGAYAEALIDFFRQSGRPDRATALENVTKAVRLTAEHAARQIAKIDLDATAQTAVATANQRNQPPTPGP